MENDVEQKKWDAAYLRAMFPNWEVLPEDKQRELLLAAHNRAWRVQDFEIDLYWKRATYFWGFQAAFLGSIGVSLSGVDESFHISRIIFVFSISLVAALVSVLWIGMTQGSKFWQHNWERHVDILENGITGRLYKTYPLDKVDLELPFSVTKINEYVIWVFAIGWSVSFVLLGYVISAKIASSDGEGQYAVGLVIWAAGALLVSFVVVQFKGSKAYRGLRMGGKEMKDKIDTQEGDGWSVNSRYQLKKIDSESSE